MPRSSLQPSEWFIIYFFLALLASLIIIAKISSYKTGKLLGQEALIQSVLVEVAGEVQRPGIYTVRKGSSCREVLKKARPKKFADLSKIDLDAEAPSILVIQPLETIRVFVAGSGVDVLSEWILKPGARVSDLKSKIRLTEDADLSSLQSRRMLLNGETIFVEKRK